MQDVSVGKATSAVILAIVVAALAVPVAQAKPGPIFGVGDNMSTYSAAAKAKAYTGCGFAVCAFAFAAAE